ncbi:unnamed protein product [Closterium sp. NIES-54]
MASWKSTGTYVDAVLPSRSNIVNGMWIFRVKRPPGSPSTFKAPYVARGFSQRQGVDYFQTFSPTPKMTTLRVLLHIVAQRDYELHSLDFSTAFLKGSLHEEIWLHHPPGFTGSFPKGTQWSHRRPVYGLREVPREWHDTLAALGFTPSTADPSLFLRIDTSLPPFYVLVYISSRFRGRHSCFAQLTDTVRLAYDVGGPVLWGMSASQLLDLLRTPHTIYAVVDSSASDSVYSSVASLGACLAELPLASVGTCVDTSPGARLEDASLSFTLDSRALHCFFRDHTTLNPLPAPVSVALADPTSGPVTARYTITLPCPAVPSGFLTSFYVPSFSRNLVGVRLLVSQHVGVWIEPSGETAVCVDGDTYAPLATFTTERGSVPASHQVAASPQVAVFGQVPLSGRVAASCSCRSLAHPTVLWHHRTSHPSLPRLRAMSRQRLVLGLPHVLPSLPPSLAPPCGPCRFFLVVVDDYSRYTTVFPLAKKSKVTSTLIKWLLTTEGTRGRRVSCLHSDRGGEFRSGILAGFCREQGIRQSWMLPDSPQQNGVAERRIGLVMEVSRTSLTYALREASPTSLWTGSPSVASRFRVWGCLALVRDTSADKLSPRAVPCVFLGFPEDSSDFTFYHPPSHQFFDSRDVRFEESTPYYQRSMKRWECRRQVTPLAVDHRLTGPFPDEPFESSGPYAELVGCLMYLMTCTRPDLASPLSVLAHFVAPGRHRPVHWTAAVRVAKYLATTSGVGLVLGGQQPVVLTGHCDSSYANNAETHRSTQGYCFGLGSGAVSWQSTRSSSVSTSTVEAEIYAGAMAAQELRWLTFLLADLGERPSSAPTLFTDNKASILLCREPRLESRVKDIHNRYFLPRELQRRGQARFEFVESEANTADIFTKALPPCDHQRCCVQLGLVDTGSSRV